MKQLALVLAALLSLTLVAPAFAQPFADVPTDHWAYDAIAELAAKGLIEGYPDGAFRGDRAMTRYEMAMVVARLLARIEAIKIPPLPPDLVRQADLAKAQAANAAARAAITTKLATVQRLVAEFRAELAALGVRVTAVEEELAAIRARLDNTRVTGDMRFRYNVFSTNQTASGAGTMRNPDARLRARITFTGSVGPQTTAVVRLWANNQAGLSGAATDTRFGNDGLWNNLAFDYLYLDVRNYLGARLWRIGRQGYTIAPYGPWGTGLLFDPAGSVGIMGNSPGIWLTTPGTIDGLRSDWALGPFNIEVGLFRQTNAPTVPGTGTFSGVYWDFKTVRATTSALLPGWTLGGTYVLQSVLTSTAVLGSWAAGRGWGFDISGTIASGITLYFDWANWVTTYEPGTTFTSASSSAWRVGGNINLAAISGMSTWNPNIDWAYFSYGPLAPGALTPFFTYAGTVFGTVFPWNMRGWLVKLNLTLSPTTTAFAQYEGGTVLTTATPFSEWWIRVTHTLSPRTTIYAQWTRGTNVVDYFNFYRAELSYSW